MELNSIPQTLFPCQVPTVEKVKIAKSQQTIKKNYTPRKYWMLFSFRWFFDATGYPRGSFIVVCNGCLMLVTFFLFRIVTLPVFWYQIWLITGTEPVAKLGHLQVTVMYLPSVVLDILNIYWFSKICKGFVKAVRNRSKNTEITANGFHKQKWLYTYLVTIFCSEIVVYFYVCCIY